MRSSGRSDEDCTGTPEKVIVRYHPLAVDEQVGASQYYEVCRKGLGDRFLKCVDDAVKFLAINPLLFRED